MIDNVWDSIYDVIKDSHCGGEFVKEVKELETRDRRLDDVIAFCEGVIDSATRALDVAGATDVDYNLIQYFSRQIDFAERVLEKANGDKNGK